MKMTTQNLSGLPKSITEAEARTENKMKAFSSSLNNCVDLFYKIGASRGKDIIPAFTKAFMENPEIAVRIALWSRDVRGGAGERQLFKNILAHLSGFSPETVSKLLKKIPEVGRWDDLFAIQGEKRREAFELILSALKKDDGLVAKWMPRKGKEAAELRAFLGLSPKKYRKLLVSLTKVVETQMCANDWMNINYEHVPSVASARYRKAFKKHNPEAFSTFVKKAVKGEVKINAAAVYPYDVLKGLLGKAQSEKYLDPDVKDHMIAQWANLPDYVGDAMTLPMVDVSGSMQCPVGGGKASINCLDVAVSLGLYLSDKNKGSLKDIFLTFSEDPQLQLLRGNVVEKYYQMVKSNWDMNTNLHAAFDKLLDIAVKDKIPQDLMPKAILILSDMQFDACTEHDDRAFDMIKKKYVKAGYEIPLIVFWNLNSHDNIPVRYNENGVALVSGFSPAIMKAILAADFTTITPEKIMLDTVSKERYDWNV